MSFRLKKLVIHEGCKYLKTLQPNTYDFLDSNSIDGFYGKNIEITAIVGKNGSGKSSLLEIIFRMMNNISVFIAHGYDVMHRVNNIFVAGIKSDLYYEINGTDCLIECRDTSIALSYSDKKWRFGDVNEEFRNYLNGNSMLIKDKIEMCKYLFFTLISNYSVQAYVDEDYITDTTCKLNTDGSLSENQSNGNAWIHFVFHKNDGYMSPININPFRDNGKIDMLKEEKLQRQRMEFLLLHYHKKKKEFIQGYALSKIMYRFDWQKLYNKFSKIDVDNPTEKQKEEEWKGQVSLFKGCLSAGNSIAKSILSAIGIQHLYLNNDMLIYAYLYITYKVLSIARTYPSYSQYSNIANVDFAFIQGNEEQRIQATMLAKDVRTDHSHIANKVFQAINFIKMVESGFECDEEKQFTWEIYNENRIKDELNQSTAIENEIRCLPPSFFDYKIYVHPKGENKELPIEHMSAGERQLYYILSTLIYHILNIKSVDTRRVHYRDVAIILDEVELGFHPDLQRKFINFIIETFERLNLNTFIRFHFIITTHSPFMLSDIRKNNILYLEKGCKIDKEKLLNPFGANINDILAQSFFLEDGFTGDFAKKKILSLLNWLSKNNIKGWDRDTAKQLIESLDEPIIKRHFEYLLSLKKQQMRKILITDEIRRLAKEYADNLFTKRNSQFIMPEDGLRIFANELRLRGKDNYAAYVDAIIDHYYEILIIEPNRFDYYKDVYFNSLRDEDLLQHVNGCPGNKKFYEVIVDKMRYDAVQKKEIRPYIKKLGIKTCVYCNASYAIATDDNKATYQVDHCFPKSKYPFLCTSFFNLQPSCMHCNQIKSKKDDYIYSMYTDVATELTPFYFSIDSRSIIKYMLTHNSDYLRFKLKSNNDDENDIAIRHSDFFHLDSLYTQFTDAAEELIWKGKIFNTAYRNQLMNMYNEKIAFGMDDFKRFYLGFYPDSKDINKRPLTLLMQGVAKEMGLK